MALLLVGCGLADGRERAMRFRTDFEQKEPRAVTELVYAKNASDGTRQARVLAQIGYRTKYVLEANVSFWGLEPDQPRYILMYRPGPGFKWGPTGDIVSLK